MKQIEFVQRSTIREIEQILVSEFLRKACYLNFKNCEIVIYKFYSVLTKFNRAIEICNRGSFSLFLVQYWTY